MHSPADEREESLKRGLLQRPGLLPEEQRQLFSGRGQDGLEVNLQRTHRHSGESLERCHAGHLVSKTLHQETQHLAGGRGGTGLFIVCHISLIPRFIKNITKTHSGLHSLV